MFRHSFRAFASSVSLLALSAGAVGCKAVPAADEDLSDALVTIGRNFDGEPEALAQAARSVERQLYQTLELQARDESKRAVQPSPLTEADVSTFAPRPSGVDPANSKGVSTAFLSAFTVEEHGMLPPRADQTPYEPSSDEHYDRTILEGAECWPTKDCAILRTSQSLTKSYTITKITYDMLKDFRWVDLNETDDQPPRWAMLARSWNPDVYTNEGGATLYQAWTVELWLPRDGRGFLWSEQSDELLTPPTSDAVDSDGSGLLRLMSTWSEQDVGPNLGETVEEAVVRWGQNQIFQQQDDALADELGR